MTACYVCLAKSIAAHRRSSRLPIWGSDIFSNRIPIKAMWATTTDVLASGLGPLGALAGGVLGQMIGLQATLVLGGLGTLLAALWLGVSPLRSWQPPPSGGLRG